MDVNSMTVPQVLMIFALGKDKGPDDLLKRKSRAWMESGFPQVVLGHRLAANLACTSVPSDFTVAMPWHTFLINIPSDTIPCTTPDGLSWIKYALVRGSYEDASSDLEFFAANDYKGLSQTPTNERALEVFRRLFAGILVELNQPKLAKSIEAGPHRPSKRQGWMPKTWTFTLARDVKLDLREEVRRYCLLGDRSSPTVQSLVRGHHKRQPCGPESALRKWIHIEPYWRGPEDAPIAVRAHNLEKP